MDVILSAKEQEFLIMQIRTKVLIILASMWAIISLVIYIDSKITLAHDYEQLERKQVIKEIGLTQNAYNIMLNTLKLLNTDWSRWNDAYGFMANKNDEFINSNMARTTFENANINFILFLDDSQNLYYGRYYDISKRQFLPLPADLLNYLKKDTSFSKHTSVDSNRVGLIKISEGYVVLSSLPIIKSEGTGPIRGTLLMGYYWDQAHVNQLASTVEMNVDFFALPLVNANSDVTSAYNTLLRSDQDYIKPHAINSVYGYTLINDVNNNPIGLLRVEVPRTLYSEGLMTIKHYLVIVVLIGILVLVSMWYLLKIFVLDRVINVSSQVIKIKSESRFSKRINISGNDELSQMVSAINSLMEIIELTQDQLKHRLLLNTESLERLSRLNENLFLEINRQKESEIKHKEYEELLRNMAFFDALTELPNRYYFRELLSNAMEKAAQNNTSIAILFLDIDKFKLINDHFGHAIGDTFLKHVAKQLKNALGDEVVARLAGDEFIIFLTNFTDKESIDVIINKIFQQASVPMRDQHKDINSTYSIGISIFPNDATIAERLYKQADIAMYYAKAQPGNSYCYFDSINEKNIV